MQRFISYLLLILLLMAAGTAFGQQAPKAGVNIDNQAKGEYLFLPRTDTVIVKSNMVRAVVVEHKNIQLAPDHHTYSRGGQKFSFTHELENTGNVPATVIITAQNTGGDDYDLQNVRIKDGSVNTSNTQSLKTTITSSVQNKTTVTLKPGELFKFSISTTVPNSARPGEIGKVKVRAKTESGQLVLENVDALEVLEGPVVKVVKKAVKANSEQGGSITYLITGRNTGDQTARALNIIVDGRTMQKVVLRDQIPANTQFLSADNIQDGIALYHHVDDPELHYTTTPPPDVAKIDEFAVALDSLAPGQSFNARFTVSVNKNAAGRITNIARIDYRDPIDKETESTTAKTNQVEEILPRYNATLQYYTNDTYTIVSRATRLGRPLLLQANAAGCNASSAYRDTTVFSLSSQKTTDEETFKAVETGPNTGFFRVVPNVPTEDASNQGVVKNNSIFETVGDDIITAVLNPCIQSQEPVSARIFVSPYGTIFDSKTGEPVAGATVILIDVTGEGNGGDAGAPAIVYGEQGEKKVDNTQTTGVDGKFEFPYVKPGTYRVEVQPPAGWHFASLISPDKLPPGKKIDQQGSYGKKFTIEEEPGPVAFDIPLDPAPEGALFIEKEASVSSAEIGDFISYKITVTNNASAPISQVQVHDMLPFGFRYQEGSTQINGSPAANPEGGEGPSLTFNLGDLEGESTATISYRVLLGVGATKGSGTNTAVAMSQGPTTLKSNQAQSTVEVRGGVFTDKGFIIGKVYVDSNKNHRQDTGEPGVPGVRIYLENGSFVITDSKGMYTFYGIEPNKHVLKIDNYTLPAGSRLGVLDNRQAGDPSTRFVDLKKGQLHRADFSLCDLTADAVKEIEARRSAFEKQVMGEVDQSITQNFTSQDPAQESSVKRAQASGTVNNIELPDFNVNQSQGARLGTRLTGSAAADSQAVQELTLEEAMVTATPKVGFMNLADNDTLLQNQTKVWIKSPLGVSMALKVNGEKIAADKISKKSKLSQKKLQAYEYIGIKLQPGRNLFNIVITDPFGNIRDGKQITVYAPGVISEIKVTVPQNNVPADGASAALIRAELLDKSGLPVKTKIPVTLDEKAGKWLVKDKDPSSPGIQTAILDGIAEFALQAPIEPQDTPVEVSIGMLSGEAQVSFLPALRPLIAAGVIEGTIRLSDGASIVPAHSADGFERELKSLSYSMENFMADARVAFFLKGKIKGNMLLTAGFDSEKDDERLFRDIQPDEYYPVYGESSVKGYEAQSTGRLYVRVDHKKTYALYGDFVTQEHYEAKSLGEYNRTQTGVKLHFEKSWGQLNIFGSQASSLQRIEEFRGKGLSGPYELEYDHILVNSEQIEIITRDRNQPAVILKRKELTRFRDYVIEPFTGNIIFKAPVPSVDENLNPIYIRVTYEVEAGDQQYLIGGADAQVKLADFLEIGGAFVEDRNPEDPYRLKSLNTTIRLGENTVLIGEAAASTTESEGTGSAGRLELQHRGERIDARIFAGQSEEDFVNRSSQLGQGRTEAGAQTAVKITKSTRLKGEFLYSSNDTMNTSTTGGLISVQQRIADGISAEAGFRYSKQEQAPGGNPGSNDITNQNIRGKLTVRVPGAERASVFGEYEQDIRNSDRKLIAVGGEYRLPRRGRIYARHEFISSAQGAYRLNGSQERQNTVIGIDASYMKNGQVYSEYRVDNAFSGRSAQAAIGVRNRFEIYEGFGINAGLERIFSLSGTAQNEGMAISTSIDYTANPLWKGTARAEARFGNNQNSYLSTLGYGRKISPNWTFLGKNIFSLQTSANDQTAARIQQRMRLGLAYRQTTVNRFDALGRYELKYEQNGAKPGTYNRLVHIFSTNFNYHPNAGWTHSARIAAKKVAESTAEFDSKSITILLSARSIHDITRKLDGGINASMMTNADFGAKDVGVGFELGYIVQRNLRLAVGFNVFGYEDHDLAASNYTRKGVYLGFSYKFDERLFRGLMPEQDRNATLYGTCQKCRESVNPSAEVLNISTPKLISPGIEPVILKARPFNVTLHNTLRVLPKDIHFASDKSNLSDASKKMLDMAADYLRGQQQFKLEITGHTDRRASDAYNLKLSQRRAHAVQRYLVSKGVNKNRISYKGLSERQSITVNEQDAIDRAINRRAQLSLDIPNATIRFIPQINDLQIEKYISKNLPKWDYIFNTQLTAVPDRIHVKGDQLSEVTKYLLDRLAAALKYYPEEEVAFVFNPVLDSAASRVKKYLKQYKLGSRVKMKIKHDPGSERDGTMAIRYAPGSALQPISQKDDLLLAGKSFIRPLLAKVLEMVKLRQDYGLMIKRQ